MAVARGPMHYVITLYPPLVARRLPTGTTTEGNKSYYLDISSLLNIKILIHLSSFSFSKMVHQENRVLLIHTYSSFFAN